MVVLVGGGSDADAGKSGPASSGPVSWTSLRRRSWRSSRSPSTFLRMRWWDVTEQDGKTDRTTE